MIKFTHWEKDRILAVAKSLQGHKESVMVWYEENLFDSEEQRDNAYDLVSKILEEMVK